MGKFFFASIFATLFLMASCIEIVDDLQINADGSGTLKYNINLSASKVKLNSYLALDSLDGKKVPSISEISAKLDGWVEELKTQKGIRSATLESDFTQFIFRLKVDFDQLSDLESGIKTMIKKNDKKGNVKGLEHVWFEVSESSFSRKSPDAYQSRSNNLKPDEIDLLKKGSYTSIVRFPSEVDSSSNVKAKIAKNRKAVMVRENAYQLIRKHHLLDQTITLKK